jgi:hypothetical protein
LIGGPSKNSANTKISIVRDALALHKIFPQKAPRDKPQGANITPEQTHGHQIQKNSSKKSGQKTSRQEGSQKSRQEEVISI